MVKKDTKLINIIIPIIVFFVGCASMYGIIAANPTLFSITRLEKDVTVTDSGIADSVEKIYDAVVVVSTYKDNKIYSTGTGFVFKKDANIAYIMTNNHVIESGSKVTVTFTDGKVIETEIVGSNALADIAVLSVDSKQIISVAELGLSNTLRVGDTTFAVGAPLDSVYSWTVTRGIISGKDRMVEVELSTDGDYVMKVLQTDAAINSGNSGGPLCNANGEVIGVNSLKLVDESVEGMGFAIPIEEALDYAEKLINNEVIVQPFLGVSMINVTDAYYYPQYYRMLNQYKIDSGVIVYNVEEDSPADKAGLKTNDIILKLNNDDVLSVGYLKYYLFNYNVGDKVTITYMREGDTKTTTVTLGSSKKVY